MGMLGAMAGAGQGLQDYATTMKEKEKMDWLEQQELVKHERAMSMQRLADKYADDRLTKQQEFQSNERKASDITAAGVLSKQNAYLEDQQKIQNDFMSGEKAADRIYNAQQRKLDRADRSAGIKEEIAGKIKLAKESMGLAKEQKDQKFAELTESTVYKESSTSSKKELEFIVKFPEEAAALAANAKSEKFPYESFQRGYAKGAERWDAMSDDAKQVLYDKANANSDVPPTEQEVADAYATEQAYNSVGGGGKWFTPTEEKGAKKTSGAGGGLTVAKIERLAAGVSAKDPAALSALETLRLKDPDNFNATNKLVKAAEAKSSRVSDRETKAARAAQVQSDAVGNDKGFSDTGLTGMLKRSLEASRANYKQ